MPLIYEESFKVCDYECDPWNRMTPANALRRIQEIATSQCTKLGFDGEFYRRTNTVFMLSRLSLEMAQMPKAEQLVRMETRGYGMRRAVYHRVTTFFSMEGERLCEADTRWVLVDLATRRIMRKPIEAFVPYFNDEPQEEHEMELLQPELPEPLATLKAEYSLCDSNGHINNAAYADLVYNQLPLEEMEPSPPRKLLLFYRSEIPLGKSFVISGGPVAGKGFYFMAEADERKCFEASVFY